SQYFVSAAMHPRTPCGGGGGAASSQSARNRIHWFGRLAAPQTHVALVSTRAMMRRLSHLRGGGERGDRRPTIGTNPLPPTQRGPGHCARRDALIIRDDDESAPPPPSPFHRPRSIVRGLRRELPRQQRIQHLAGVAIVVVGAVV